MNEVHGVPIAEATAKDFMMVRAALVKRLGGADAALVWARIYYRCDEDSKHAEEHDGLHWWKASHGLLATETGLTEKQARVAIESLVAAGYVARENFGGRVYAYRPVTYLPNRADSQSATEGRSIRPEGQMNLPDGAVAPLIDIETKTPSGRAARGTRIPEPFVVDDLMRRWATSHAPQADIEAETERFVDYWRGRTGQIAVKADWPATWRNWIRRSAERVVPSAPTLDQFAPGDEWMAFNR